MTPTSSTMDTITISTRASIPPARGEKCEIRHGWVACPVDLTPPGADSEKARVLRLRPPHEVARHRPLGGRRARALAARSQACRRHERRDGELPARGRRLDEGAGAAQGPVPSRRDDDRVDR